jgi:hypothetical protein
VLEQEQGAGNMFLGGSAVTSQCAAGCLDELCGDNV